MALRNIIKDGDPALKKVSREITKFDKRLHTLLDDMAETMKHADGLGLAAVQVGVLRRAALVMDSEWNIIELINPEIVSADGEVDGAEGCLSFPDLYGIVCRPERVTVEAQDRYGKKFTVTGEGITARAMCHEIDHLNGIVFTDKAAKLMSAEELEVLMEAESESEENE